MVTPAEFRHEWAHGDREVARAMARGYVEAHRTELGHLLRASIEELVAVVTAARNAGNEEARTIADMVLLMVHAPQRITGEVHIGGAAAVAMAEAILAESRS